MVAQSCETVYETVNPSWGRTSPIAASTADDHQPMDLVTRKRGQSDDQQLESSYGSSSKGSSTLVPEVASDTQEEPSKLTEKQDLSHGVAPQQSNQTKVVTVLHNQQHHQLCQDGDVQEPTVQKNSNPMRTVLLTKPFSGNTLDQSRNEEVEKFQEVELDDIQSDQVNHETWYVQSPFEISSVQQSDQAKMVNWYIQTEKFDEFDNQLQACSGTLQGFDGQGILQKQAKQQQPMKLKQMKQELLSRWKSQNSQQQDVQSINQEKIQQSQKTDKAHNNGKQIQRSLLSQDYQIVYQEQPVKSKDKKIVMQSQQIVSQKQPEEGQRNVRIVFREEPQQQHGVSQDSPQNEQPKVNQHSQVKHQQNDHVQQQRKVKLQSEAYDKESASEGASSLLLLADCESPKIVEDNANPLKEHMVLKQYQRNTVDINTNKGKKLTNVDKVSIESSKHILNPVENQGPEDGYFDDEKDGSLVIIDGNTQIPDLEGLQDDETHKPEVPDNIEILEYFPPDDDIDILDTEEKQGSGAKSSGRLESQKKMEEGKLWLVNNLMFMGSLSSVIKLSDIEASYRSHCKMTGKEPLATPVLARLIHSLFPMAKKCRLGARGNQRIHYRSLIFKSDINETQQQSSQQQKDMQNEVSKQQQSVVQNEVSKQDSQANGNCTLPTKSNQKISQQIADNCTLSAKSNIQTTQTISEREKNANQQEKETDMKLQYSDFVDCDFLESESQSPLSENKQNDGIAGQDDEEGCKPAAKKLSDVLKWITSQGEAHKKALLRDFAHSASCQKPSCMPVCLMFRRVRRHVVNAQHSCSVLRLYSMLLRHHVSSCTQQKCGLPACPALRATRPNKRPLEQQLQPAKRAAVTQVNGLYRPSSMVLAPRSPGGSLPGSPVNSPPASPSSTPGRSVLSLPSGMQSGQVQYVVVPIMMPIVENRVA